jgi:hypothetical protein
LAKTPAVQTEELIDFFFRLLQASAAVVIDEGRAASELFPIYYLSMLPTI